MISYRLQSVGLWRRRCRQGRDSPGAMGMQSPRVKESTIDAARLAGTEQRRRWAGQNEVAYGRPLAQWTGLSRAEPRAAIWAATFDLMRIAVLILDAAGYCIEANEAADRLLAA